MSISHSSTPSSSQYPQEQVDLYRLLRFAIENEQPLVVLYATGGTEDKARVIVPYDLYNTVAGADIIKAHDSLSNEIHSFRVDRVKSAHHLVTV